MKTVLKYSFGAIGFYLLVFYGTNSGTLLTDSSTGAVDLVKAFQGR